jgi:type IV secretory pathway VirB2 component (pilin)
VGLVVVGLVVVGLVVVGLAVTFGSAGVAGLRAFWRGLVRVVGTSLGLLVAATISEGFVSCVGGLVADATVGVGLADRVPLTAGSDRRAPTKPAV